MPKPCLSCLSEVSTNESSGGWNYNVESFHVFCSWEGPRDLARVEEELMRFEQRIGRIDRIGQRYPTVTIHNFYYDGTVEAKVYRKLRDRVGAFESVVGNLQPILAQVPTFIERATMSVDAEEMGKAGNVLKQVLEQYT